jgi:hypothetical protein
LLICVEPTADVYDAGQKLATFDLIAAGGHRQRQLLRLL